MCVNVAWTTGCTFGDAEEALKAAAANSEALEATEGCGHVLWTAGCSFADVAEAAKAAQAHLDAVAPAKLECVSTMWTAVCTA